MTDTLRRLNADLTFLNGDTRKGIHRAAVQVSIGWPNVKDAFTGLGNRDGFVGIWQVIELATLADLFGLTSFIKPGFTKFRVQNKYRWFERTQPPVLWVADVKTPTKYYSYPLS